MIIPSRLKDAIAKDNLVIFVGAGLSRKLDLPSWKQLVKDVILEINAEKYNPLIDLMESTIMTPLEVLEKIKSEHNVIRRYIRDHFQVKNNNLELHKRILSLSSQIVTTNYDDAFEQASNNELIPAVYTSEFNMSEIIKSTNNYLFKLHGTYSEPDNCILFRDQYDKLYLENTAAKEKLKTIFNDKTILFLGFSFSDTDINLVFNSLNQAFGNNNKHFIITTDPREFSSYHFLEPIQVDDYSEIDTYIEECIKYKNNIDGIKVLSLMEENSIKERPNIAVLLPHPIDIEIYDELYRVLDCFNTINCKLFLGCLNIKTLEKIEDFDLLVIASKTFKSKVYIEDENLKSNLCLADDLCASIPNDTIPILFITDEKLDINCNNPILNISTLKSSIIKKVVFKLFREGRSDFMEKEVHFISPNFPSLTYSKGESSIVSLYGNNRDLDIGRKSLSNVVGRVEEQSALALKVLSIIRTNKLLNIKGSGGIGKTTIIKKVGYELYNRGYFKQGVTFHSCENVKSYDDFEEIVKRGFNLANILNLKDYLQDNYSFSKIDLLIILDNLETVVNLPDPSQLLKVITLLRFISDYANIAVTSREKISDSDQFEDMFTLTPLITDDAEKLFISYYGNISKDEVKILRQDILEDLLNNNPLAIKLVTKSRPRHGHLSELRQQLREHFFESTNEDYSAVFNDDSDLNIERTRSIFQSVNYSYATLNSRERIAFELLSLFPDGITLTNFKKCFEKKNSKNNVSDRELRVLRNKSLVEDYNGTLQLQPIIRRFADFQFNKRSESIKNRYCSDAYSYNSYIMELIEYINNRRSSESYKFYNKHENNLFKVLSYLPNIELKENEKHKKRYILNYINSLVNYTENQKQVIKLLEQLNVVKPYFDDLKNADITIKVLHDYVTYYHKEFDNSYKSLSEILDPNDMDKRNFGEEDSLEIRYRDKISMIHSMEGHTTKYLNSYILNNSYRTRMFNHLFYLGIPTVSYNDDFDFYFFEYDLMFNRLSIPKVERYIATLHPDEHLEIMQTTYLLSKVKKLKLESISRLVVTNPYTKGLKQLMEAFIHEDDNIKDVLFSKALKNLFHIKYYYLEALYYYCKYLRNRNNVEFEKKLDLGIKLANQFKYQYLDFLFNKLKNNNDLEYEFNFNYYDNDGLQGYIEKYNLSWKKYFHDNSRLLK